MEDEGQTPERGHEPGFAIVGFWLTIFLYIPAWDFMSLIGHSGSPLHFAIAALAGTALLATVVGLMIVYVGFRNSPIRIGILLALTLFFSVNLLIAFHHWNDQPEAHKPDINADEPVIFSVSR